MAKYVLRTFAGWSHWRGSMRWYGSFPTSKQMGMDEEDESVDLVTVLGFVDDDAVEAYYRWGRAEIFLLEAITW